MGSLSIPKTRQNAQPKMPTATITPPSRLRFLPRPPPPNCFKTPNTLSTITTQDSGLLFREKLLYLSSLRINLHKALTLNPNLRSTPLSSLQSIYQCLSSMGLTRQSIGRILDMHPSILTSDPDHHLYSILDFLINDVNIPFPEVSKSITRCPRLLVSSIDTQLRPALLFLQSLGFVGPNAINSQTTVLLVYNVESTLMAKIEYLMSLGFECEEVKNMVVRSPGLLTFSVERNLVPKVRYFLEEMKGDLKELKRFPQYFSFSLEKKIKPRHRMLVENGLKGVPLSRMLRLSDGEFNARLVDMQLRMAGGEGVNVKNIEGQVCQMVGLCSLPEELIKYGTYTAIIVEALTGIPHNSQNC